MRDGIRPIVGLGTAVLTGGLALGLSSLATGRQAPRAASPPPDATAAVQDVREQPMTRPEQKLTDHDRSGIFDPTRVPPASTAFEDQPEKGMLQGFDFARDPLDAKRPLQPPSEIMKAEVAMRPKIMATQRQLLASR